ncbi:MAG TPA: glycosyltransferase family 2 protein [Solirubrobacterales bacterium]|jgi:GT2 family glycosyltransferase|nr:glycosyltransferase family 2 protein [Solirubrobacterales bacterium]
MRPAVYIPHFNGFARLERALASLREQTRPLDVVVVDNGSSDGSQELLRERFAEVALVELDRNVGFGPALNRAIAERPGDPVLLLNNDVECEPRFVEAMLEAADGGTEMVAGVLLQEAAPQLIDSAGVVADRALMGFDYLHGEPLEALPGAPAPLGPTGGAALYRLEAFRAAGGFDERIFLYYEDLDLALRLRAAGARCALAPGARAIHAYSASSGAASGFKYAHSGWSRGYMLRRYGVHSQPGRALRALAAEAAICAGQLVKDRTARGLAGRVRGWRDGAGLERRQADETSLLDIPLHEALARRRRRRGS